MQDSIDRRAAERLAVNAGTACAFVGQVEDVGASKIRDVSMSGLGIILNRRLEVGQLLVITLTNTSNPTQKWSKTILVKVAHVTSIHGGFLIGGTFLEPLTYQEFTSLVM